MKLNLSFIFLGVAAATYARPVESVIGHNAVAIGLGHGTGVVDTIYQEHKEIPSLKEGKTVLPFPAAFPEEHIVNIVEADALDVVEHVAHAGENRAGGVNGRTKGVVVEYEDAELKGSDLQRRHFSFGKFVKGAWNKVKGLIP